MEYVIPKTPAEIKDYSIDWSAELADGETIASATWTFPAGITKSSQVETGSICTVYVSGGTGGRDYELLCEIVTDATPPRTYNKTLIVPVTGG